MSKQTVFGIFCSSSWYKYFHTNMFLFSIHLKRGNGLEEKKLRTLTMVRGYMGKKERGIFWVSLPYDTHMGDTKSTRTHAFVSLPFLPLPFTVLPTSPCLPLLSSFTSLFPSLGASLSYTSYVVVTSCYFRYQGQLQKTETQGDAETHFLLVQGCKPECRKILLRAQG
jgi:hypothetical protein